MVDFSKALSRSWNYAKDLNRIGVLTLLGLIAMAVLFAPLLFMGTTLTGVNILQTIGGLFVGVIVAGLIFVYTSVLFTHNYANQKSLGKSSDYAKSVFLRFLAALIIIAIINMILSVIPIIGIVLVIVATLMLLFVQPEIAVSNTGLSASFSNSYDLFMKNKLDVVITVILAAVLGVVLFLIFMIPMFIVAGFGVMAFFMTGDITSVLAAGIPMFIVAGIIFVIGMAFTFLFTNSIKTDVYMQLKKGKSPKKRKR